MSKEIGLEVLRSIAKDATAKPDERYNAAASLMQVGADIPVAAQVMVELAQNETLEANLRIGASVYLLSLPDTLAAEQSLKQKSHGGITDE